MSYGDGKSMTPPMAVPCTRRCWPRQSCLRSTTASTRPLPGMRCLPTPGTMPPGPSAQPSAQAVRPECGPGTSTATTLSSSRLARTERASPFPQAARFKWWSAEISWTAPRWPRTTAAPTANCLSGSVPATQNHALQSKCAPWDKVGMFSAVRDRPQGGWRESG